MSGRRVQTDLLLQAGRLLLEYNESAGEVQRALAATAKALDEEPCHVAVAYGGVTVSLAGEAPALAPVAELRYNAAVQARVHQVLEQVRWGHLDAPAALDSLARVEAETPRHSRWLAALVLSLAAASLAGILGADVGAAATAAVAAGLGLLVRQELGRRHVSMLALPLTAAFIGAVLGGIAIRLGWTQSPELVLIVPALMVVPGPHLINSLLDLIDNYVPMSLSRLGLATGILLASALGIVLGIELTIPDPSFPERAAGADHLNLVSDMALAGVATCGFAVFYNTPWRHVGLAAVGGMAGHGLRFLALDAGCRLEAATFLGGLAVGAISACMARSIKAPVAVISFAGAVTMIPGLNLYRALAGALQLARPTEATDSGLITRTLTNGFQGGLVVCGLAIGLILGARLVLALTRERARPAPPKAGHGIDDAAPLGAQETTARR
jgi:uncharacterized membrane protein YjjP (DUF1212 family)